MSAQHFMDVNSGDLRVTLLIVLVLGIGGVGWILGRISARPNATREVQHALDRAARDLRKFRTSSHPHAQGPFAQRALLEAEYILHHRTIGLNYLEKPTGESQMRPPEIPRRQWLKRDERNAAQRRLGIRNQIVAYSHSLRLSNRPDDTYAGTVRDITEARYATARTGRTSNDPPPRPPAVPS